LGGRPRRRGHASAHLHGFLGPYLRPAELADRAGELLVCGHELADALGMDSEHAGNLGDADQRGHGPLRLKDVDAGHGPIREPAALARTAAARARAGVAASTVIVKS